MLDYFFKGDIMINALAYYNIVLYKNFKEWL